MALILKVVIACVAASVVSAEPVSVSLTFRDSVSVNDTAIHLGDIAVIRSAASEDKLISLKNVIVGEAAPAGYSRRINTDEVFTYVLKNGFKGFSFEKTRKKTVMVATAYQEKKVGDFEQIIQKYLRDSVQWQDGDFTVFIRNTDEKWKCLDKPISAEMAGLSTRYPKGNVNLTLIARQLSRTYSIPVLCKVTVFTPVVTAKAAISRGTALSTENCMLERKDITRFACAPFTSLSQLQDLIANRTIQQETILHEKLTTRQPIIGKDEQVDVVVDKRGVRISIIMRAREQGALGDRIWVENELTHKLLKTKIIGKGKVELLNGEKTI